MKDTTFLVQPYLLFTEFLRNDEMTTPELDEHIANMKATGTSGAVMYEIEKQRRTASAFSIFIFTIIGVSIASRKIRGGLGFHLIMGIAMCALYEVFMKTTTTFSTNANLPAIIGVWIPNVVYMIVAIYFYKKAQR
jgi:lipopolysaccharide export system permease protein